jgi:hypothetical protein
VPGGSITELLLLRAAQYARPITDQGVTPAISYFLTDEFGRTVGSGSWGTADTGTGWATPATNPTGFSVNGSQGLVTYVPNQYRIYAGQARADMEMRFKFLFPVASATSASMQILVPLRAQGINDAIRPQILLGTTGGLTLQVQQVVASTVTNVGGGTKSAYNAGGYSANEVWWCKSRVVGTQCDVMIWKDGTTEPSYQVGNSIGNWAGDSTTAGGLTGAALTWTTGDFGFHISAGAGNPGGALVFDSISVTDPAGGVSDSVGIALGKLRTATDTGATITDSVGTLRTRVVSDTGVSMSDSVGAQRVVPRTITDQGVTSATSVGGGKTNSAEGGTNGTTVSTGNSGGGSGDAFDVVSIGSGTLTYDSSQSAHGGLSIKGAPPGTQASFGYNSLGTLSDGYARAYVRLNAVGGIQDLFRGKLGGSTRWTVSLDASGHVLIKNSGASTVATSTLTVSAAAWFRLEAHHNSSADLVVRIYTSMDSATIAETLTAPSGTTGTVDSVDWGLQFGSTIWYDDLVAGANTWPGPAVGVSDSVVSQRTVPRAISDTGTTITDSIGPRLIARKVSDTGTTITDAITSNRTRLISDTGVTPELLDTDTFTRTTSNGWGVGEAGTPAPTYVLLQGSGQASEFATDGTYATIATVGGGVGVSRTVGIGASVARAYVLTKVRLSSASPGANYDAAAFIQWVDANNHVRIRLRVSSAGALTSVLEEIVAGTANPIYSNSHGTYTANTDYWLQIWNDGTQLVARVWKDGTTPQPLPAPNNFLAVTDAASMAVNYASITTLAATAGDAGVRHLLNAGVSGTMTTKFDSLEIHQRQDSVGAVFAAGAASISRTITDYAITPQTIKTIAHDADGGGTSGAGGSITWNHTVGSGTDRYLLVGVAIANPTDTFTVTYNGVPMTSLGRRNGALAEQLFGLANPAVGTNAIVVTRTGTSAYAGGSVSFFNADQFLQLGSVGGADNPASTNATGPTLTGRVGDVQVAGVAANSGVTAATGTQAFNDGGGDAGSYIAATGSGQAISWTNTSTAWAVEAIVLQGSRIFDQLATLRNRLIADTGTTISDSVVRVPNRVRAISDTGVTNTDSVGRAVVRQVSDTGVTQSDSVVGQRGFLRTVTDTGNTTTDSIGRAVNRVVTDTGVTQSDSVVGIDVHPRAVTDTGATITDSVATARNRAITDTGTTISDSVVRTAVRPRPISDTGATITDTVSSLRNRLVTDTGTTISDSVATQRGFLRPVTDTGATITDAVASMRNRLVADTGATITDSVARTAIHPRLVTDTGASISDSVATQLGRLRTVTDTGTTISDSVAIQLARQRPVSDTGATITDAVGRAVARKVTDTGVTLTDSVVGQHAATRPVSDTGTTITDTVSSNRTRQITDTGTTITDSVVRALVATRPITDTGATISDSVAAARNRPKSVTDTGATITDTVASHRTRQITDTGSTITDSIRRAINRLVTDTGVTQTDTVGTGGQTGRTVTDTGTTISDSLRLATVRQVSDTGATITDSVQRAINRRVTDTGTTITDSVVRTPNRVRSVTDTGTTITDSLRRAIARQVSDQGATISDSLQLATNRRVSDTGATISDSVVARKGFARSVADTGTTITDTVRGYASRRNVTDQGATISDSVASRQSLFRTVSDTGLTQSDSVVVGGAGARSVTDTGVSQSDSVRRLVARTTITDTGTVITDTVDRYTAILRTVSDTGATVLDTVNSSSTRLRPISDTGTSISDNVTRQRVVPRTITDTGSSITDNVTRPFVIRRVLDDGTTITDDVVARRVRPNPVVNVEMTLRAAGGSIDITTTVEPISSTSTSTGTLILTTRRSGDGQLGTRGVGNMTLEDR